MQLRKRLVVEIVVYTVSVYNLLEHEAQSCAIRGYLRPTQRICIGSLYEGQMDVVSTAILLRRNPAGREESCRSALT